MDDLRPRRNKYNALNGTSFMGIPKIIVNGGTKTEDLIYLNTSNTFTADTVEGNRAIFNNISLMMKPEGSLLPETSINSISIYYNGQYIPNVYFSLASNGTPLIVEFNESTLGFNIDPTAHIIIIGKVKE